jgi:hypothetical protein
VGSNPDPLPLTACNPHQGDEAVRASPPIFSASPFSPRPIVLAAIPVIRETVAMPPYPALLASVAAKSRRPRWSRCGDDDAKRSLMGLESFIRTRYAINPQLSIAAQPDSPIG